MTISATEGYVPFRGLRTWYRIAGPQDDGPEGAVAAAPAPWRAWISE